MFDLSLAEVLLIVVVAVVFIGPKELPVVIRGIAKAMRGMRGMASEIRQAFDDLSRETGLKEAADEVNHEMRLIKGDDGTYYEAFDLDKLPVSEKKDERNAG